MQAAYPEFFMWYAYQGEPPLLTCENNYWEPIRKNGMIDHWRFRSKKQNCNCGNKATKINFQELDTK